MTSAADRAPVADVRHAVPGARAAVGEPDRQLVEAVRTALAQAADPERAAGQQAYMKSAMPYRGLTAPVLSATLRPLFAHPAHRVASRVGWEATVRALWDDASYREERYAAIALTGYPWYAAWQDPDTMPLFRHLITTGAWWDYVDQLASRRVGPILRAHPGTMASLLRDWARAEDHWLRRTAIIAQLGSRASMSRTSSCARRSGGRCVSTPGCPARTAGSARWSTRTATGSARCRARKPSSTCELRRRSSWAVAGELVRAANISGGKDNPAGRAQNRRVELRYRR